MIRCEECSYDLRGHSAEDRCPECGVPVSETMRRLESRQIDLTVEEYESVGQGLSLAFGALACLLLVSIVVLFLRAFVGFAIEPRVFVLPAACIVALVLLVATIRCDAGLFSSLSASMMVVVLVALAVTLFLFPASPWLSYLLAGMTIITGIAMGAFLHGLSGVAREMQDRVLQQKLTIARSHFIAVTLGFSVLYLIGWPMAEWETTVGDGLPGLALAYVFAASLVRLLQMRSKFRQRIPHDRFEQMQPSDVAEDAAKAVPVESAA